MACRALFCCFGAFSLCQLASTTPICSLDGTCEAGVVSLLQSSLQVGDSTVALDGVSGPGLNDVAGAINSAAGSPCYPESLGTQGNSTGHMQPDPFTPPPFDMPAPRSGLKQIYYINVDSAVDRREVMEKSLQQQSVPYARFPAVNTTNVFEYDEIKKSFCEDNVSLGTRGCTESHIQLYKQIVREDPNGTDAYLILEDDASLMAGWEDQINGMLQRLPSDAGAVVVGMWGMARCENLIDQGPPGLYLTAFPDWVDWMYFYTGSTATVVWPYTLPTLLEKIEAQDKSCHADANLISSGKFRSYAMYPAPIAARRGEESGRVDESEQIDEVIGAIDAVSGALR